MKMRTAGVRAVAMAAMLSCGIAGQAMAAPLTVGDIVEVSYRYPDLSTLYAGPTNVAVADPGVELLNFASFVNIDLQPTFILITTTRGYPSNAVPFDGLRFTDINSAIPAWTAALNVAGTTYVDLLPSAVTFDDNNIWVNVADPAGPGPSAGSTIRIDLAPVQTTAVPEPASLVLLGTGLSAVALRMRRKRT